MIQRKKKICQECQTEQFIFSKGLCLLCYNMKNSKRIKPVSSEREKRLEKYNELRISYLKKHRKCEVKNCNKEAVEIHHPQGRIGERLFGPFLGVCREHHMQIEQFPDWAKQEGYTQSRINKE